MKQSLRSIFLCASLLSSSLVLPFDGSAFKDFDKSLKTVGCIILCGGVVIGAAAAMIIMHATKK